MTIGENITAQIASIIQDRKRPKTIVRNWMRRNNPWYRELVAQEWERQTGDDWEKFFWSAA